MDTFDFIVLGGGSGGIAGARRAALHGAKVALVEQSQLGGTCVNQGCVPKKVMWNAAQISHSQKLATDYGFAAQSASLDWMKLCRQRDEYILRLNGIYRHNLEKSGVEIVKGRGEFESQHIVKVGDRRLKSDHILIATGGAPLVGDIPGGELGITSDGFFKLTSLPPSIVIIGSGYIGVEIAGLLHELGTDVTMIIRGDRLLAGFDGAIVKSLMESMQQDGIKILTNSQVTSITPAPQGMLQIDTDSQVPLNAHQCLWAIGRKPLTHKLGLDLCGIKLSESGTILTDENDATSCPGIYAVGDVVGKIDLTPVAIAAARRLSDRLFAKKSRLMDYQLVPSVVFSHPPLATIGLSEDAASSQYGANDIKVFETRFTNMFYALSPNKPKTHMRLVTQKSTDKVLGIHLLGHAADEILQGFAVALKMGATKADFDNTIAIHPCAAEELVTMT